MKLLTRITFILSLLLLPSTAFAQGGIRPPKPKPKHGAANSNRANTKALDYIQKGDFSAAYSSLKNAAEAGNAEAQIELALMYQYGIGSIDASYEQASKWHVRAGGNNYYYKLLKYLKDWFGNEIDPMNYFEWYDNNRIIIYFPAAQSELTRYDKFILDCLCAVIKRDGNSRWEIAGWEPNYMVTAEENIRIRNKRARAVADYLIQKGVAPKQLSVCIHSGNFTVLGVQGAQFDRAVTICEEY